MKKKEAFEKMAEIVAENVKAYQTDLAVDRQMIDSWDGDWWAVWMVRDLGTQLQKFSNAIEPMQYVDAVMSCMHVVAIYRIEKKDDDFSVRRTTIDNVRKRYDKLDQYKICLFGRASEETPFYQAEGTFDDLQAAEETADRIAKRKGAGWYTVIKEETI